MPSDTPESAGYAAQLPDTDPVETAEWLESLDAVTARHGPARARYLLVRLEQHARDLGLGVAPPV